MASSNGIGNYCPTCSLKYYCECECDKAECECAVWNEGEEPTVDIIEAVKSEHQTQVNAGILPMESQFMMSLQGLAETLQLLKRGFPLQYNMLNQLFEEHAITKKDEPKVNKTEELIEAIRTSERANYAAIGVLARSVDRRLTALGAVLDSDIVISKDDSFKITVKPDSWTIEHRVSTLDCENWNVSTVEELVTWLEEGLCPGYLANLVLTAETAAHHQMQQTVKDNEELKRELLEAIRTMHK